MLILQRKKGESLLINENITVSVTEVGSDWVKLAIDAPRDVKILRSELAEAAHINQEAAQTSPASIQKLKKLLKGDSAK